VAGGKVSNFTQPKRIGFWALEREREIFEARRKNHVVLERGGRLEKKRLREGTLFSLHSSVPVTPLFFSSNLCQQKTRYLLYDPCVLCFCFINVFSRFCFWGCDKSVSYYGYLINLKGIHFSDLWFFLLLLNFHQHGTNWPRLGILLT